MNYILTINKFWKLQKSLSLGAPGIAIYFLIFNRCNALKWKRPASLSNLYICRTLKISENTLIKYRVKLVEYGLIEYTPGSTWHTLSRYSILDICDPPQLDSDNSLNTDENDEEFENLENSLAN